MAAHYGGPTAELSPRDGSPATAAQLRRVQSQAALQPSTPVVPWTPQKTEFVAKDDSAIATLRDKPRPLEWMGTSLPNLKTVAFTGSSGLASMAPAELVRPLHAGLALHSPADIAAPSSSSAPLPLIASSSAVVSAPLPSAATAAFTAASPSASAAASASAAPPRPASAAPDLSPSSRGPASSPSLLVKRVQASGTREARVSLPPGLHRQSSYNCPLRSLSSLCFALLCSSHLPLLP